MKNLINNILFCCPLRIEQQEKELSPELHFVLKNFTVFVTPIGWEILTCERHIEASSLSHSPWFIQGIIKEYSCMLTSKQHQFFNSALANKRSSIWSVIISRSTSFTRKPSFTFVK